MDALTPSERRGALIVVCLLALGAGHDLWRAGRPLPVADPPAPGAPVVVGPGVAGPAAPEGAIPAGPAAGAARTGLLDLNRASAHDLDALPGIGPVLAARIIAYREAHGPFRSREDLMGVRGIGPRLYARVGPRVGVGPPAGGGLQSAAPDSNPVQIPVQPTGAAPDNRQ